MSRKLAALFAVAAVAAGLAACSSDGTVASCAAPYQPGAASSIVTATGTVGEKPTVDFPTPLVSDGVQLSVLEPGEGALWPAGSWFDIHASLFSGADATPLQDVGYDSAVSLSTRSADLANRPTESPLDGSFACLRVGERFALTASVASMFGSGATNLPDDTTIVVVFDVLAAYPGQATGAPRLIPDGFPALVTAPDGVPAITLPDAAPPAELRFTDSLAGSGAEVKDGDTIVAQYRGWVWPTTAGGGLSTFDDSWTGSPRQFVLADGKVVDGFRTALVGQRVGSQVIAIIPPDQGYGDQDNGSIPANSTLIFVIDILGIAGQ